MAALWRDGATGGLLVFLPPLLPLPVHGLGIVLEPLAIGGGCMGMGGGGGVGAAAATWGGEGRGGGGVIL